ncbi:hypothetical protein HDU84_004192 [Entophlyctis sp. JEL0112]|nr:hypothetical protein HDU84_004192 [Entophlyctis sp. JEL0112]
MSNNAPAPHRRVVVRSPSPARRQPRGTFFPPPPSSVVLQHQHAPVLSAALVQPHAVVRERPTASTISEYLVAVTALIALLLAVDAFVLDRAISIPQTPILSTRAFAESLEACRARNSKAVEHTEPERARNPRFTAARAANVSLIAPAFDAFNRISHADSVAPSNPLLIKHATVWNGVGARLYDMDLAIANGQIAKIGKKLATSDAVFAGFSAADITVWDVDGRVVSPGIVDMHSHVGLFSVPGFSGESDVNEEEGGPIVSQMRAIDSFNPLDKSIDLIASGGVTTSLVIPGSGTLMGGEGFAIKMARTTSNSVDNMLLNHGMKGSDGKKWRWMKMACGENPKSDDWGPGVMPDSRMGSGWLIRERLNDAKTVLKSQATILTLDDWCATSESLVDIYGQNSARWKITSEYPRNIELESLVALLRGDVLLQIHCYQVNDIDMMLRNKHEFEFNITAFHHATEAHLVAAKLAAENISVALFADHSIYKREAYKHSVNAGQILKDAGVKVAYKSDHPVLNAQNLIYEAQKAVQYGLDEDTAFSAVTSVPAERIGAGNRIGRIAPGYDADIVVWDRPPLELGAHPLRVVIDGSVVFSLPWVAPPHSSKVDEKSEVAFDLSERSLKTDVYTVTNITKIFADENKILAGSITVESGKIACIGVNCPLKGEIFNARQGVVIPGLISTMVPVGLQEIGQEPSTQDGAGGTADAIAGFVLAKDGIRVGGNGKLQEFAYRSGVLTAIVAPKGRGLAKGVGTAIRTGAEDAIVVPETGFFMELGHKAKEPYANSISTQYARLRNLLKSGKAEGHLASVLAGEQPLVVTVHDPSDITKLLLLTEPYRPTLKLVISGGSGAWLVADEIARARVPVLLLGRCQPYDWEQRWCKPVGSAGPSSYEVLKSAGVNVAISVYYADQIRDLWFEGAWMTVGDAKDATVDASDAVASVTWRVADIFGIGKGIGRIAEGKGANFVVFDGGPVGFGHRIRLLADGESVVAEPRQE